MAQDILLTFFEKGLDRTIHLLHILKNNSGDDILETQIIGDMFPLKREVQIIAGDAKAFIARLCGIDIPIYPDTETTIDDWIARFMKTEGFIYEVKTSFTPLDISEVRAEFPWNLGHELQGEGYVYDYVLQNFYFHLITLYNILRKEGFDIGKKDYLGELVWKTL